MRTFEHAYNPHLAVEVLALVRKERPDATMTMGRSGQRRVGLGPRAVNARGLGEAVSFPGFLDEAGKARAFTDHDVFLNTNRIDNTPVSVIEAAAHGLPIVATEVGGIPYLLADRETASSCPMGTSKRWPSFVRVFEFFIQVFATMTDLFSCAL